MSQAIDLIMTGMLIFLALLILVCLVKAIIGPRVGDRLVCINMIGTLVIVIIGILSIKLSQGYLVDISIIYAAISFLAVAIFCKIYMGVYIKKKVNPDAEDEPMEDDAHGNS